MRISKNRRMANPSPYTSSISIFVRRCQLWSAFASSWRLWTLDSRRQCMCHHLPWETIQPRPGDVCKHRWTPAGTTHISFQHGFAYICLASGLGPPLIRCEFQVECLFRERWWALLLWSSTTDDLCPPLSDWARQPGKARVLPWALIFDIHGNCLKMTYPIQLGICSCCHEKETVTSPEYIAQICYIFYYRLLHTPFLTITFLLAFQMFRFPNDLQKIIDI